MQTNQTIARCNVNRKLAFGLLISLITLLAAVPKIHAQNGVWTNLVAGNASGNYSVAANWSNSIVAAGTDNTADFSQVVTTTNSVLTLDIAPTLGNLIFGNASSTNWNVTGSTLTLNVSSGSPTITVNNQTVTNSEAIAGTNGFTKLGAGTLILNAANTISSNINLNAGITQVRNAGGLGAIIVNSTSTLSNIVMIASNTATLQMSPAVASGAKPVFASGAGVGGTQGAIYSDLSTLAQNTTSTRLSIGLTVVQTPALTMLGDTTIRVDGTNFTALGSALLIGHVTTSNALTGIPANYTNYTLTKTGTGKLAIDPATGYSGGNIHVAQGALKFDNQNAVLSSQTVTVDAGTILQMGNTTSMNSPNSFLVLNGLLEMDGRGTGTSNSDTTVAADVIGYLSGSGVITNGEAGNTGAGTLTIGGTNGSTTTFSGTIPQDANGSVGLRLQNTNSTLKLTGANTYQGVTAVNAGTLFVNGSHLGGGPYSVASGATLCGLGTISASSLTCNGGTIVAGDPSSPGGTLTLNSGIVATAPGALIISNATLSVGGTVGASGSPVGTLYMTNGTLQIPLPTSGSPAVFANAFNVDGSATINYSMITPITGVFPIISYSSRGGLAGGGTNGISLVSPPGITATLSNDTVNAQIDIVITVIPVLTWNGVPNGNWDIGTATNWAGGLTYTEPGGQGLYVQFNDTAHGTTTVNLTTTFNPHGVIVNNNTLNYTFTGVGNITGTGSFLKEGTNSLIVANSGNSFNGGINLQQGTLQIGNGGTTGDLGASALVNQGTLALNRSDTFTLANTVSGPGNITKAGAGAAIVSISGNNTGAVSVNGGTLLIAPVGAIPIVFSNAVTGTGAFGVNGAGTLILLNSGNNYSSGTVISNGTLQFGDGFGNGALPPAGNITDNGTLALTLSGTLANNVSGNGGVSIVSNVNVTFSGSKTYTGPTLVLGGSVTATASSYPSGSVLTLGDQAAGTVMGTANFTAGNPMIGGLNAGGQSTSLYDTINLGAGGQVLTINGNVSMGYVGPVGATASSLSFQVIGSGASVVVNTNGGTIQIGLGATGSGVNPDNVFVDFSGIDNFVANLGTSTNSTTNSVLNIGTLDGNPGPGAGATVVNQLNLANVSNSITAGTITVGAGGRQLTPDLRLGPGTNIFNVGTFNVGTGGRDGGTMEFNTGSGGLKVRGAAGGSTGANYNQGVNTTSATSGGFSTTVDFTGGTADLLFGTMIIGNEPVRVGQWTNVFTFSQGVLNATSVSLSQGGTTNLDYSIMNISGGTATLGPVSLTASRANGTLNISGASVTVQSISYTNTGTSTLSINNATLNVNIQGFGNPATAPVSAGSFTASGTVNLGVNGNGFAVAQFPLISYTGSIGGSGFPALNLASLPAGVSGYLSNNTATASVDLVITSAPPAINPYPTNILVGLSGNQVTLSWPSNHIGWLLQSNSVGLTSTGAWVTVIGSDSTNQFIFTLNPAKTNVFFRMLLNP